MGREVRKVPANWCHPVEAEVLTHGRHEGQWMPTRWRPLLDCERLKYLEPGEAYDPNDYMPCWLPEDCTHLQMYETCSEGTPISPVMETPEELARWLFNNKASAWGSEKATYEEWLATIKAGWAPSGVVQGGRCMSGVAAALENSEDQ